MQRKGKYLIYPTDILILNLIFTIILDPFSASRSLAIYMVGFSMHDSNVGPFHMYNELLTLNDLWISHFQ